MKLIVALLALFLVQAKSAPKQLCHDFVPKNDLRIPVSRFYDATSGGISEATFNEVMDKYTKLYEGDFKAKGQTLQINRLWTDETVNASAEEQGTTAILNMYGGLARHHTITRDAFALVICHETGHHLGGAPKIQDWYGENWASNEGQADYYAGLKCLRRFFADEMDNWQAPADATNAALNDTCKAQFTADVDQKICLRSSLAGLQVARLFKELRKETVDPSFDTPDKKVVTEMFDGHPGTQCRLDTYFAGATCQKAVSEVLSDSDYKAGSCATESGDKVGVRPLCWFLPGAPPTSGGGHGGSTGAPRTTYY